MELVVAPIAELRPRISRFFEDLVSTTLVNDASGTFSCGVTGGSTALIFLGALRDANVEWSRISVFWGDERAVPPDHPDSNFGLAERLLIDPLGGRAPGVFRMEAENPDLHGAARAYEEVLKAQLPRDALDLLILGIGDDGHICSLFPGHPALTIEDRWVIAIEDSPKPPPKRLTLTMPFVLRSQNIWVIAVGPRKLSVLQRAIARDADETPIDHVVRHAANVTVFTDQSVRRRG
jgi:6-phosphogluconolactonase